MTLSRLLRALFAPGLIAVSMSAAWSGVAGRVDSVSGSVMVGKGAQARILRASDQIIEGDLLTTDKDSWALLEMIDGATLTVRPQTQLRIDSYVYSESQASGNKSFLSLFQGAFRAVTGAIGAVNPRGYIISTPTATIGIRGTDHETAHYPPGMAGPGDEPGTYDKVNAGETFIRTPQGREVRVRPGRVGFAHLNAKQGPRLLASIPGFYRRHAELDRRLGERIRAIRERHDRVFKRRRQDPQARPDAGRKMTGQKSRREQALEARRKQRRDRQRKE